MFTKAPFSCYFPRILHIKQRFIITAGKGGVGRTTVSAALAVSFAMNNQKTLLATADRNEKQLARLLGRKVGTRNTRIRRNLDAVSIKTMESIKEYTLMILKIRYIQKLLVGTRAMQSFIANIPGITEWAVMGKATYHLTEKLNGGHRYDRIVLDTPPTGHSLSLLKIPYFISRVIGSGPLHSVAEERLRLLTDSSTTGILLVTLPEEMAVSEALDMHASIRGSIGIPVLGAVVNRKMEPLFSEKDELRIEEMASGSNPGDVLKAALFRIRRTKLQDRQIDRIGSRLPVAVLPEIYKRRIDGKDIENLADMLEKYLST